MRAAAFALALGASLTSLAAMPAAAACRYHLEIEDPGARHVAVTVACDGPGPHRFAAFEGAQRRATKLPRGGPEGRPAGHIEEGGDAWILGAGPARYEIDLEMLAREARGDGPKIYGRSVMTYLGTLLLQPEDDTMPLSVTVAAPEGAGLATALTRRDDAWHLTAIDLRYDAYALLGTFDAATVDLPGPGALVPGAVAGGPANLARLSIAFPDGTRPGWRDAVTDWIRKTGSAVADYWQGFPVDRLLIVPVTAPGSSGVPFGRVMGGGGATMMLRVGSEATTEQLFGSWVLVHEMTHLAAPFVRGRATWFMEGMATYIEPILRSRVGWTRPEALWSEFARDMPRGLDALERESLGRTSFGGVYWGGALFFLLADLDMRRANPDGPGVEHCLRRILLDGGNTTTRRPLRDMLAACDAATGGDTMRRLAARYVDGASPVDLPAIWRQLGVSYQGGRATLDESAPLAAVRRAIALGRTQG